MFAVVFEVEPKPDRFDDYLFLAAKLKPRLEKIDGFIDVERFKSKRSDRRILSLSIWRETKIDGSLAYRRSALRRAASRSLRDLH